MKTTTIGRIGAIVTGAAMLGTAVASAFAGAVDVPTELSKGFFVDNGTPMVQIVVGEKGQASDGAAAGQIAAMIGNMAFTTTSVSKEGGSVEVAGGTTTCTPSAASCGAGSATGNVKLSWTAIGLIGELEQKQMDCDIYDGGLEMSELDDGGDTGSWCDSSVDGDDAWEEQYGPEDTVGTRLVGSCELGSGADIALLKTGEFENEICTICYSYCDIALGCEPHKMSEWVEIQCELIDVEYDCAEEELVLNFADDALLYNVFTDDIVSEDLLDDNDDLVAQSYLGRIIIGGSEYYVEDLTDDKITIVCGATGTATTTSQMTYTVPAMGNSPGNACAPTGTDTYSIKLVGAQTIEDTGVVDVTLEVTKPDGTTEQITSGISGTPVVGDLKIKLQRGTAASNVITGEQSFSADLLVWYVPSEYTFEDGETYNSMGVESDDDEEILWDVTFQKVSITELADLEDAEDFLEVDSNGMPADIEENEQYEDCYDGALAPNGTDVLRNIEFAVKENEDAILPENELIQLPFNDAKYLVSNVKFGYKGLMNDEFMTRDLLESTTIEFAVEEVVVFVDTTVGYTPDTVNGGLGEELDLRAAMLVKYEDEYGETIEARLDEGPFEEGDVVLVGDTPVKITDLDEDPDDVWNLTYEYKDGASWDDDDDNIVVIDTADGSTYDLYTQTAWAEVILDWVETVSGGPLDGVNVYIDEGEDTDDESDDAVYMDKNMDGYFSLATTESSTGALVEVQTELDGARFVALAYDVGSGWSEDYTYIYVLGDDQSGAEDDVDIYPNEYYNDTVESRVMMYDDWNGWECDALDNDCEDYSQGEVDGQLISLSGALVDVTGDRDVPEYEDSDNEITNVINTVKVTVPEDELRPTLFFGIEESGNSSSITIDDGDVDTIVNIGGVDVTVDEFGVSVSGGGVIGGEPVSVTCPSKTATCPAVSVDSKAPATIGYKLVVLDSEGASKSNLVLVGGPAVNTMTKGLVEVSDLCPAKSVIKMVGSKLVVAGCEAGDTMAAAQSLVDWLKSNA